MLTSSLRSFEPLILLYAWLLHLQQTVYNFDEHIIMQQPSTSVEQHKKPTHKYCIVPKCKNTIRSSPAKVFFLVPRGADIRRKWCKIIKRDMVSPSTCLYCCEDHFNVEEDTSNYMQYKILNLQGNQKTTLRLKKGIVPHKFLIKKNTKSQLPQQRIGVLKKVHLEVVESALSAPPGKDVNATDTTSENYLELEASSPSSQNTNASLGSCSSVNAHNESKMHVDKPIQVCCESYNSVNVISVEAQSTAVSPILSKTMSTSPLIFHTHVKIELLQDKDEASISSDPSLLPSSFEPDTMRS